MEHNPHVRWGVSVLKEMKIKWINQPDVAISQVYHLSFKYSSTCFGHPHAHHQELNNCCSSLWSWLGQSARPRPTALLPPRSSGEPEAATAVIELLMMSMRMPETCWAVFKRQVINLWNCCIWSVDSFECMMMQGLKSNPATGLVVFGVLVG